MRATVKAGRPILVGEDNPDLRELLSELLWEAGYPVETAPHGRAALERIAEHSPSLVLLDMNMPVLDGWGFAQELARRGWDPPLVLVTATAGDAARHAQEVGAVGYVPKPYDLADLLTTVERYRIP